MCPQAIAQPLCNRFPDGNRAWHFISASNDNADHGVDIGGGRRAREKEQIQ